MKKIYNYTFQLLCIYIIALSLFSIFNFEMKVERFNVKVHNVNQEKSLVSTHFTSIENDIEIELEESESIKGGSSSNSTSDISKVEEETVVIKPTPTPIYEEKDETNVSDFAVISSETVNISHYGPDCIGCMGYTASGYYVGDGRLYYQDSTFGSVRVVAADRKYPLGTILRIGYRGETILAIVLDRGGAIGDGKRFQIDLLTSSEQTANVLGIVSGAPLEVLRLGY